MHIRRTAHNQHRVRINEAQDTTESSRTRLVHSATSQAGLEAGRYSERASLTSQGFALLHLVPTSTSLPLNSVQISPG